MEKFRAELKAVRHFNPSYYNELLDTIDQYIEEKPDITIETCKSIIEGLSKMILIDLNQTPESDFKSGEVKLAKLFKDARGCLKDHIERNIDDIVYDDALIECYGNIPNILEQLLNPELVARIGTLRNEHGDISHGRTPLKIQANDIDLAEFIVGITDNLCTYMLRKFSQTVFDKVQYEDNPEFNLYLDELYPLDGKLIYSEGLYEMYFEDYDIELTTYLENQSLEEPGTTN